MAAEKWTVGFQCRERWTDAESRRRERRWGRVYHSRTAAEWLAALVGALPAGDKLNRTVVCVEVRGGKPGEEPGAIA